MMTIIRHGKYFRTFECPECGCMFATSKYVEHDKTYGGRHRSACCPECGGAAKPLKEEE